MYITVYREGKSLPLEVLNAEGKVTLKNNCRTICMLHVYEHCFFVSGPVSSGFHSI